MVLGLRAPFRANPEACTDKYVSLLKDIFLIWTAFLTDCYRQDSHESEQSIPSSQMSFEDADDGDMEKSEEATREEMKQLATAQLEKARVSQTHIVGAGTPMSL